MQYCPSCGESVTERDQYCSSCGRDLTEATHSPQQPSDQQLPAEQRQAQPRARQGEAGAHRGTGPQQPQEGQQPPAPGPEQEGGIASWPIGRKVVVGASLIGAIGAFLPWVTLQVLATSVTKRGIEADGRITLLFAILVFITATWRWTKWSRVFNTVTGFIILGLGTLYIVDPLVGARNQMTQQQLQYQEAITPGIGLYLTAIAGLLIVAGIVYDTWFNPDFRNPAPQPPQAQATGEDTVESTVENSHQMEDEETDTSTRSPRDSGDGEESDEEMFSSESGARGEFLRALGATMDEETVTTDRELKRDVYPEFQLGYESADAWWEDVRSLLQERDEFEQLDSTAKRWRLQAPDQ